MSPQTESEFLRWVRRALKRTPAVLLGSGDDAAVIRLADRQAVLHVDQCVEGIHFRHGTPWRKAGAKALLRCASDIAAMGCRPVAALAAAALPERLDRRERRQIVLGLESAARHLGVAIAGGDLSATKGPAVLGVTVLGEVPRGTHPIPRSGARPGDLLAVTGCLGGSSLGRHLTPHPRIREALALQRRLTLHAMIDLSDGLAADLTRLLDESRAGATLVASWVPLHPDARRLGRRSGRSPLAHALGDGEDYELLFAFPRTQARRLEALGFPVHVIGQVTPKARRMLDLTGHLLPLPRKGYEHQWK